MVTCGVPYASLQNGLSAPKRRARWATAQAEMDLKPQQQLSVLLVALEETTYLASGTCTCTGQGSRDKVARLMIATYLPTYLPIDTHAHTSWPSS